MRHDAVTSALCSYVNKLLTWEFVQQVCTIFNHSIFSTRKRPHSRVFFNKIEVAPTTQVIP